MSTQQLIDELIRVTQNNSATVTAFKSYEAERLNWRQSDNRWSILECMEHLNRYGDFYIPEINKCIETAPYKEPRLHYKSGLWGGYFTNMMKAESGKKIKSLKSYNPIGSELNTTVLDTFITQQEALLVCLDKARKVDLIKNKTAISLSKLIRLQLGDTLSFVIYHNERHIKQALNVCTAYNT